MRSGVVQGRAVESGAVQRRIVGYIALVAMLAGTPLAIEQLLWSRANAGENGVLAAPDTLSDPKRTLTDITLADVGADLVGMRAASQGVPRAAAASRQSALRRYTWIDAPESAGRGSAEDTHVFAAGAMAGVVASMRPGGWHGASSNVLTVAAFNARRADGGFDTASRDP